MAQIALFLIAIFTVTWTLCLLLRPAAVPGGGVVLLAWLLPTVWSPTVVALILTARSDGGLRREIRQRLSYSCGSGRWLMIAPVIPALATAIAVFIGRMAGDAAPFIPSAAFPIMVVMQLATGAVGEELGWRGFLLPRLGQRLGEMTAACVMSILWSLWHVAGFLFPGTPHHDLMPLVPNLLFIAFFGVFLAFIFYRTGESVLATILAHLSLNITLGAGGVRLSSLLFWWVMVGIYGVVALFIAIKSSTSWRNGEGRLVSRNGNLAS